jgi:hypothetical protein
VRGKAAGLTVQVEVIREAARVFPSHDSPIRLGIALSEHGRLLLP